MAPISRFTKKEFLTEKSAMCIENQSIMPSVRPIMTPNAGGTDQAACLFGIGRFSSCGFETVSCFAKRSFHPVCGKPQPLNAFC